RGHLAALLRDHHLPQPDAQSSHVRMEIGGFRVRWELHTEFVTWTFSRASNAEGFGEREPATAIEAVPQEWLARMPGELIASLHLWVLPARESASTTLVKHVLHEDTLDASTVADGHAEVYTDFALHAGGFCRVGLVDGRIDDIGESRLAGLQTIGEFVDRRLSPARATCEWVARRQDALSQRVSRISNLLRTRVEIDQQQSSQALLATMNRRQGLQLQLQATVEGLSVAAI